MTSTNDQTDFQDKKRYFTRESPSKATLYRRFPIAVLLIYYIFILFSAWSMSNKWSWSLEDGLAWSSGGAGSFFPIPSVSGVLTVITPASLIDQVFYLIFMHYGIWIVWIALGILYLFSPYRLDARFVIRRLRGKVALL